MSSNKAKSYELRNIHRIDNKSKVWNSENHGWQVRFIRRNRKFSQWFDDNIFGSREKALEAAMVWRDAMEKELGGPAKTKWEKEETNDINLIGVKRRVKKYKNGYTYTCWEAVWPKYDGGNIRKAFGIPKFGEDEALRLAIEARNNGISEYNSEIEANNPHIAFTPPSNIEIKIWRYMDFTKFVSMLQNNGIFLSRVDSLSDPFEGSFSRMNKIMRPNFVKHSTISENSLGNRIQELRSRILVSCWHMNENESAAMWNLYAKTEEAICIQSTYKKLNKCIGTDAKIGSIQYIDYENTYIEENNPLLPFLYKRKSFEHERELRVIKNISGINNITKEDVLTEPPVGGLWLKLDLKELIENIFIAPQAPIWFGELVEKSLKTYSVNKNIKKSSLEDEPFF